MKLVRDFIPDIIEKSGQWCLTRTAVDKKEHLSLLRDKILEETDEFIEDPSLEEAADILEVLITFCTIYDLSLNDVIKTAERKAAKRGGFKRGIILQKVGKE